jgi:hypothetical protein
MGKLTGHLGVTGMFELPALSRFSAFPEMVRNVCQSVEFCLQEELGLSTMVCPLVMIIDSLRSWPGFDLEIVWAQNALGSIQNKGVKSVKYLPEYFQVFA